MRLPIAMVKLDPRLTAAANGAARRLTVLESLVRLGHTLGIQVVAQGIETPEQLTALCRMGCDLGRAHCWGGRSTRPAHSRWPRRAAGRHRPEYRPIRPGNSHPPRRLFRCSMCP